MAVNAAAKADQNQERFYDALRELFVGAKVEGESGFINLMCIKSDSVEFEDGTAIDLTKRDFEFFKLIKPMVWW